jgi:hypothetical protein
MAQGIRGSMNLQFEIISKCALISESIAALHGITQMWYRAYMFACACVYAMLALSRLLRLWGMK